LLREDTWSDIGGQPVKFRHGAPLVPLDCNTRLRLVLGYSIRRLLVYIYHDHTSPPNITGRRVLAHDNGMDMNMDQGVFMNMGNMIMYLLFTVGDNLCTCPIVFLSSQTSSIVVPPSWRRQRFSKGAQNHRQRMLQSLDLAGGSPTLPPFILEYDISRGILQLVIASIDLSCSRVVFSCLVPYEGSTDRQSFPTC
jgi:hypothetical protein